MELNRILKLVRQEKLDLNDKDNLKSKEFEEYLKSISKKVYEKLNLDQDKLKLTVNENNSEEVAYIKKDTIYINLGAKIIKTENKDKLKLILGYYAHEIGHRLFTDFSIRKIYENSILNNKWYPRVLEFEDEKLNENKVKMDKYIKDPKKSGKICSILLFIYDIIEDSKVEEYMYSYLSNYGRLIEGLNVLRCNQYKNIGSYKTDLINHGRFYAILNQIICYIKFGEFKDFSIDEMKNIKEVENTINEAINEVSESKVLDKINKIAVIIWDEIELYLENFKDIYEENSTGIKALMSFEVEKDLYENSKAVSTTGETDTKGEAKENIKDIEKNIDTKKDLVGTKDTDTIQINADKNMDYKSSLAQDENALKLKNTSKKDNLSTDKIDDESKGTFNGETCDKNSFGQGKFNLDDIKEKVRELNKDAREIPYGDIHKDIKIKIYRPEFTYEDKLNYLRNNKKYIESANELARQVLPLLENEVSSEYSKNRYYGTKFNASDVVKNDFRYFGRKNPPNESPSMAIALRVDESGSMKANGRIEMARATAIFLWEFCKKCEIPIGVYGDTADISQTEDVSIYSYSDFANQDSSDCYRMMQISPKSNNRDGVSIKFVAERLLAVDADIKLLFIISDGKPLAKPNYKDNLAKEDLKKIVSEYSRRGISFLVAAIGNDREVIKEIYGDDKFLDISNLNNIPNRIAMILKNLV